MKILILAVAVMLGNAINAQTQKTAPQKTIDSVRAVQIKEQRETTSITPPLVGVPQTQPQKNATETRTIGTSNPLPTDGTNLPIKQQAHSRATNANTAGSSSSSGNTNARTTNTGAGKKTRTSAASSTNNNQSGTTPTGTGTTK